MDDEDELLYGENDNIPALSAPLKPEKPLNEKKECHTPWYVLIYFTHIYILSNLYSNYFMCFLFYIRMCLRNKYPKNISENKIYFYFRHIF